MHAVQSVAVDQAKPRHPGNVAREIEMLLEYPGQAMGHCTIKLLHCASILRNIFGA